MQRHRHQEFIRFLNRIEAAVPAGKLIHAVLDNYAAHKHPKGACLVGSSSALDLFTSPRPRAPGPTRSRVFCTLTRRRLQRGVFHSLVDLQATIKRYLAEHNRQPKPFVWTADPDRIIEKVNRGYQAVVSYHSHVRLSK
jgi:hypothetical protein